MWLQALLGKMDEGKPRASKWSLQTLRHPVHSSMVLATATTTEPRDRGPAKWQV